MASSIEICNSALQKLGASRIVSLTQDSKNARACNTCYEHQRDAELRAHQWNFSIERATLAADSPVPDWGPTNSFTLPSDFLRLADPDAFDSIIENDWQIEGRKIFTNDSAPLYLRYVKKVTDVQVMDSSFKEALACRMAIHMCEELTQSNTKKAGLRDDYRYAIAEARKINSFENVAKVPPQDDWINVRS